MFSVGFCGACGIVCCCVVFCDVLWYPVVSEVTWYCVVSSVVFCHSLLCPVVWCSVLCCPMVSHGSCSFHSAGGSGVLLSALVVLI